MAARAHEQVQTLTDDRESPGVEPTETDPTADLVAATLTGDRHAFGELHARYCRMVHAVVLVRTGPDESEDLVQEVFLSAWRQLSSLREPGAFGPWLRHIAINRTTDHLRRRRPGVQLPTDLAAPPGSSAEGREVLAALLRLPRHLAEPLAMRLLEGMTGPEIAAATGLTHGSVRVTQHRAMKRLREDLGAGDE